MKAKHNYYQQASDALDALEDNESLSAADNFVWRINAIDTLELYGVDGVGQLYASPLLIERARALRQRLEDANHQLIDRLLSSIRAGDRDALKQIAKQTASSSEAIGYDELDALIAALLDVGTAPDAPLVRDPDMIGYQPTPVRIILRLIEELDPTRDDIFYDLGAGLGHVPILVNLLAGIKTVGVELEKSYCRYALACLKKLNLRDVALIQADARHVSYNDGTIFYLYTPFQGEIMREVLHKLEVQGQRRRIRMCTYGPCTLSFSRQGWLKPIYRLGADESSLGIFTSL